MKSSLIVALDVESLARAESLVKSLAGTVHYFKIGSELFTACGPDVVEKVRRHEAQVFLDLKFHDIPNTVARAVEVAASLGVAMCNVHASGGLRMMEAAVKARNKIQSKLRLLAVTVLTSMSEDDLKTTAVESKLSDHVLHLANLAKQAGMDGVVCSAWEAKAIRKSAGKDFLIVTPGIRPSWAVSNDQKRFLGPKEAFENGADFIVVGRPIIQAENPVEAAKKVLMEIPQ